jgi:hypothetical protein
MFEQRAMVWFKRDLHFHNHATQHPYQNEK